MYKLNCAYVLDYSFGAIRCDGTVNCSIQLTAPKGETKFIELNSLTIKQSDQLEIELKRGTQIVTIDKRFLQECDFETFCRQNGIVSPV